jgi:hypothetical protein
MINSQTTVLFIAVFSGLLVPFILSFAVRRIAALFGLFPSWRIGEGRTRASRSWPTLSLAAVDNPAALPWGAHFQNDKQAEAVALLGWLREKRPSLPVVIGTLRKMNAYAFEELVAFCLDERGMNGYCPPGYSRDGGIDCIAYQNGRPVLVQAKRWKRHINNKDLISIANVASTVHGMGLFIHTGRTGKKAWRQAFKHHVSVISGDDLVNLVLGNAVEIPWREPTYSDSEPEPLPRYLPLLELA